MKLLYCIVAIVVSANAQRESANREDLQNVAKLILQQIQDAPKTIDKIIADTNAIVTEKLLANPRVNNTKVTLNDKLAQIHKNDGEDLDEESKRILECGVTIIEGFNNLVTDISNDLLQKVTGEQFNKSGDRLITLKKDLADAKDALENHLDEEIKTCFADKFKCRLTGDFLLQSQEYFTFVDIIQPSLLSKVKASDKYFNSLEIGNAIITKLTKPAYDCLNSEQA